MERLTEMQSDGCYDLKDINGEWCNKYCEKQRAQTCKKCGIYQAIQKLAEYENSEEQGLLLRLPCKVGTKVYTINRIIDYGEVGDEVTYSYSIIEREFQIYMMMEYAKFAFGKTVFLTQAEAEQKLKEMESE